MTGSHARSDPEAALRSALAREPDDEQALVGLGNLLIEQKRFEEACEAFARLADLRPEWSLPQVKLGNALAALDREHEAENAFRRALELEPSSEWPLIGLGELLRRQGRLDEAQAAFCRLIELYPNSSRAFLHLSRVFDGIGQKEESLAALEAALDLDPANTAAWTRWLRRLDATRVDDDLRRRLAVAAHAAEAARDPIALKAFGRALAARGELRSALSAYDEACAIDPDDEEACGRGKRLRLQLSLLERHLPQGPSTTGDGLPHGAAIQALFEQATAARARYSPVPGRILVVTHDLACGGKERQLLVGIRTVLESLAPRLESITLLCRSLDPHKGHDFFLPMLRELPIEIARLDFDASSSASEALALAPEVEALLELFPKSIRRQSLALLVELERRRPAVVDSYGTRISDGLAAVMAGVPRTIFRDGSLSPEEVAGVGDMNVKPYLLPCLLALGRLPGFSLTTNSQAGVRSWEKWLGDPRCSVTLLPNIVEAEDGHVAADGGICASSAPSPGGDAPVVGTAIRFSQEKDPRLWVRVAGIVAGRLPNCRFLMLGDGPLRAEVEADIRSLGLEQRFTLPGRVSDPDTWLRQMDVLLLTSRVEGAPNIVLEAQLLGVPIVSTRVGGVAETLHEGRTGYCIEGADAARLADRVVGILSDPDWTARARRKGPEFVLRKFTASNYLSRLLPLYDLEDR